MSDPISFKVILVGDGATGKTTFVTRHITGEFRKQYISTIGVEIRQLPFYVAGQSCPNGREVLLNVHDTAGQEKFGGLRDGYYVDSDACLLFFDVTNRVTYKNVESWYRDVFRICPTRRDVSTGEEKPLAIVLVGNKCDVKDREIRTQTVKFHRSKNIPYVEISAKDNFNYELPILSILRTLLNDPTIQFSQAPALLPADIGMDAATREQINKDLEAVNNVPLPDDD
ncbi:GTP-binding nuclear protein RAN/TC4 [Giardia duodenalis assemblage B]|uniref:GTP-binding nuclear protein n=3 Tax=Giardia intestinalis TaxID=5741 RepID=A0A132NSD0_GIAIN|nr:GTP-binding nuclear protein RAN/TC4 [Giardia intestinalis ATCC 50581]ESU41795.1 GTP-binding nuclear protein RAN/TC4 [Giardia intestinalis]KWX12908.1 GTP-binding nuclear protein RAN/TC4 [Giardia intestinalis assemblage B]